MPSLSSSSSIAIPRSGPPRLAVALRRSLAEGYNGERLRADLGAGLVVGILALPLSMALAIASGVPPQHGLYTAIVAGTVIALLGGSKFQVSGPTAAFVVILAPIASRFGLGGLLVASLLAGLLLIAMGLSRLGKLVEFVPYPVTTGFTAGIALVIGALQLKDLLGLEVELSGHFLDRLAAILRAVPSARVADAAIAALTLALLVGWPRISRRVPAPLVALAAAAIAALLAERLGFDAVATIDDRFSYLADGVHRHGIPRLPPVPLLPWRLPGPDGAALVLDLELLRALLPSAFTIAILGAIESLLSAVVADGLTGKRHDPDGELVAQGIGNLVAPFFGGFAATGAIARTATNVRAGARSPIAAVVHSLAVLVSVVALAPLLGYLPMAALAAMLLHVAIRMSEARHVARLLRTAPKSDVVVLVVCFTATVLFDMVVAVTAGIVLASLLFMQRMAAISGARLVGEESIPELERRPPKGLLIYEISGPLFFGAAEKAMTVLRTVSADVRVVLFDLRLVPMLDATGLVALEATIEKLRRSDVFVVLAGVQSQPLRTLARAGFRNRPGELAIGRSFEEALALAIETAESRAAPPAPASA